MQTFLSAEFRKTPEGQEADRILRSCVHCGFCTATCPTYRLLGDELDSPRGRIYLIKGLLEGKEVTATTQLHLDRCLTCRACETFCPSGVEYGHLLDIGRQEAARKIPRSSLQHLLRRMLAFVMTSRQLFTILLRCGRWVSPFMPERLKRMVPPRPGHTPAQSKAHARRVILFRGCVQPALAPQTNAATIRVLDRLGIQAIEVESESCCGALDHHLSATEAALKFMKANIDSWWPLIEQGVEAIVTTASGCGVMVEDYGYLLREDEVYKGKAARVSALARDISEIVASESPARLKEFIKPSALKVAFQNPCTLQHGQKLKSGTQELLQQLGYSLCPVSDGHLCCGSAGTYSLLQPGLSRQLRSDKMRNLMSGTPDIIVTANIGCQLHLQQVSPVPVKHWIELLDEAMT